MPVSAFPARTRLPDHRLRHLSQRHRLLARRTFSFSVCAICPGRIHSRRGHRCSGAKVTGAGVSLRQQRKSRRHRRFHGRRQLSNPHRNKRAASSSSSRPRVFRQLQTPGFYAGGWIHVERNVVLEPEWVRESIVVTATGTPTPQPQTSAATTRAGPRSIWPCAGRSVSVPALMPGTFRGADRTDGRADFAVCPRRRLR
jgi:hypothetical protein